MKTAIAIVLLTAATAHAGDVKLARVCAEADTPDARQLLVRALEAQDLLVVDTDCDEHYAVSHEIADDKIVIHLDAPSGRRKKTIANESERYAAYRFMIERALAPAPTEPTATATATASAAAAADASPVAAEPPATTDEVSEPLTPPAETPATERPATDLLRTLYVRAATGSVLSASGSSWEFGYRHERGHLGIDSALEFASGTGTHSTKLGLQAFVVGQPGSSSLYAGGGASLGSVSIDSGMLTGGGMSLELTAGYEWKRHADNDIRTFLELQLTQPLYEIDTGFGKVSPTSFLVAFGFGIARK